MLYGSLCFVARLGRDRLRNVFAYQSKPARLGRESNESSQLGIVDLSDRGMGSDSAEHHNGGIGDTRSIQVEAAALTKLLGGFALAWIAWSASSKRTNALPERHFSEALEWQLVEIKQAQDMSHKINELLDIISVTLNWLRWHGLTPADIAHLATKRALTRYLYKTEQIIAKYEALGARPEATDVE